jgi:hypothetical protein
MHSIVGRRKRDSVSEPPVGCGMAATYMVRQKRVDSGSGMTTLRPSFSAQYIGRM